MAPYFMTNSRILMPASSITRVMLCFQISLILMMQPISLVARAVSTVDGEVDYSAIHAELKKGAKMDH